MAARQPRFAAAIRPSPAVHATRILYARGPPPRAGPPGVIMRRMPRPPALTRSQVNWLFDARSFERGAAYALKRAIAEPRWATTGELSGRCRGSGGHTYRVAVSFDSSGNVTGTRCTCPVGDRCKHATALLLTWADHPDRFDERVPLDRRLAERSRNELVLLIGQILRQFPDAEALLDVPPPSATATVTPEQFEVQVAAVFERCVNQFGSPTGLGPAIEAVAAAGEDYLAMENPAAAVAVYAGLLREINRQLAEVPGLLDDVFAAIQTCVAGLRRCLTTSQPGSPARQQAIDALLAALSADIERGGTDEAWEACATLVDDTTWAERAVLIDRVDRLARSAKEDGPASAYANLIVDLNEAGARPP